jgi:hypothetical protein
MTPNSTELVEMSKWLQNIFKAMYLTAFSIIGTIVLTIAEFLVTGSNNPEHLFEHYLFAQIIVSFAFINGNLKIEKM